MSQKPSHDNYCLQWENFQTSLSSSLNSLRSEPENSLCDVTLISDDELNFSAHKVILSACSPFFKNVFSKTIQPNPFIYLGGVSSKNLSYLLDFIYIGKVQLRQDDIDNFLDQAQKLKVSGLSVQKVKETLKPKPPMIIIPKTEKFDHGFPEPTSSTSKSNDPVFKPIEESAPEEVSEPEPMETDVTQNAKSNNEVLITAPAEPEQEQVSEKSEETPSKTKLDLFMEEKQGTFLCKFCDFSSRLRFSMKNHVESHIKGFEFKCDKCLKVFGTKKQLNVHSLTHETTATTRKRSESDENIEQNTSDRIQCSNSLDVKIKEALKKIHFNKVNLLDDNLRKCFDSDTKATPIKSAEDENAKKENAVNEKLGVQVELEKDPNDQESEETSDVKDSGVPSKIKVSGQDEAAKKFVELSTREGGIWNCKVCGYSTKAKNTLQYHMETHFEGLEYPCPHCSKVMASKNSWNVHKSSNHRDVMIIDDSSLDGSDARKDTEDTLRSGVDAKQETKTEPIEAVEPMLEDSNRTMEEEIITTSEPSSKQIDIEINSNESRNLSEPVVESEVSETMDSAKNNEDVPKNYETNYDDFFLEESSERAEGSDSRRYNVAKIKVSSIEQAERLSKEFREKVEPGLFRCTHCGFRSRANIRTHILSHFEGLEFKCDQCDKTYNTKHSLVCHKSQQHRE